MASALSVAWGAGTMLGVFALALLAGWLAFWQAPRPPLATEPRDLQLWQPLTQESFRRLMAVFVCNGIASASAIPAALMLFFAQDRLQAFSPGTPIHGTLNMQTSLPLADGDRQATTELATQRLIALYEQLSPAHLATLDAHYAPDAHFKDPFNDVRGVPAFAQIFAHMFATLDRPRFTVSQHIVQGDQAFLGWEFRFRMRRWRPRVEQCIHGATLVRFDAQGCVMVHRDYWDAAGELYEKLPVLGGLMRWLHQSASATAPATKDSRAHRPSP